MTWWLRQLLKSRLFLGLVGGGAVLLCLVLGWQLGAAHMAVRSLKKDLVATADELAGCKGDLEWSRSQVVGLRGHIDAQNTAIDDWKRKAADVEAEADRRVAQARADAAQYRARAAKLAKAKAPAGDRCTAASRLYVETLQEERR